jgi:hypothetical protein
MVAGDAGFFSASNEAAAHDRGVKRVCIPSRSTKSANRKRESWLFLHPPMPGFRDPLDSSPGSNALKQAGIEHVVDWSGFASFLETTGPLRWTWNWRASIKTAKTVSGPRQTWRSGPTIGGFLGQPKVETHGRSRCGSRAAGSIEEGQWTEKRETGGLNIKAMMANINAGRQRVAEAKVRWDALQAAKVTKGET